MFDPVALWMFDHPVGVIAAVTVLAAASFALVMLAVGMLDD